MAEMKTAIPESSRDKKQQKRPYMRPELRHFGQVSRVTQGSGGSGNDGILGMTMKCDRRTKQAIVKVGDNSRGLGLYLFNYRPEFRASNSAGRQLGFMADEVEAVCPEAVSMDASGYQRVDYGVLAAHLKGEEAKFIA